MSASTSRQSIGGQNNTSKKNTNGRNQEKGNKGTSKTTQPTQSSSVTPKARTTMNNVVTVNNKIQTLIAQNPATKRHHTESPSDHRQERKVKITKDLSLSEEESNDSDMSYLAAELENRMEQQQQPGQQEFTKVLSKKEKLQEKKRNQLPAIRVRISQQAKPQFNNPIKVKCELERCFPSNFNTFEIKFIEYAKYDERILVIATDDKKTHDILNKQVNWPNNAFNRGVKLQLKSKDQAPAGRSHGAQVTYYNFSIRIETEIDIENTSVKEEFKKLGFCKAVRTIKKLDNTPTTFVRLTTTSKEKYDSIVYKRDPIMFFYQRYYSVKEIKPHQCWNCQGIGHLAFDCPSITPTCLQCGESHRVKECPHVNSENKTSTKTFCSNCRSEQHHSASRECPLLKEHVKQLAIKKNEKPQNTTVNTNKSNPPASTINYKQQTQQTKPSYSSQVKNIAQTEEIAFLKQQIKDLISLVSIILQTTLSKNTIEIPNSLKSLLNA